VHPAVHITVTTIDIATMSSIVNILVLSCVASHAYASFGSGFLPRASSETRNPTSEQAASTLANVKPEGVANAALIGLAMEGGQMQNEQSFDDASSEVDNSDSDASTEEEIRNDIEAEASDLRQTKQEVARSNEWLNGAEGSAQQDVDDSQEDDSSKDADQLQNEVSMLEDQVGNEEHSIETAAPPSSDDGDDDPALLQNDAIEVQDESVSSDDDTELTDLNQAHDDDQDARSTQNDTSMLKELVHNLVTQMHLPDHAPESRTDPELITVLIQTMNKHASIFGAGGGDDSEDMADEADDMGDESDDDDDSSVEEDTDEAGGEADDEASDETSDEDIDDEDSSDDSSDEGMDEDDTGDGSSDESMDDDDLSDAASDDAVEDDDDMEFLQTNSTKD